MERISSYSHHTADNRRAAPLSGLLQQSKKGPHPHSLQEEVLHRERAVLTSHTQLKGPQLHNRKEIKPLTTKTFHKETF
jgi:hypothetical protein